MSAFDTLFVRRSCGLFRLEFSARRGCVLGALEPRPSIVSGKSSIPSPDTVGLVEVSPHGEQKAGASGAAALFGHLEPSSLANSSDLIPIVEIQRSYFTLFVTDLRRSVEFYRDVVGLRLEMMDVSYAAFRFRGCTLSLYEREFASKRFGSDRIATLPYPVGRTGGLSVEVEDVDHEIRELERRGATILVRPGSLDRERVAAFVDPDGNLWEVTSIVDEEGP